MPGMQKNRPSSVGGTKDSQHLCFVLGTKSGSTWLDPARPISRLMDEAVHKSVVAHPENITDEESGLLQGTTMS
jgi:hypothetical protein